MNSLGKISTVRSIIQNVTLWIVCFWLYSLLFCDMITFWMSISYGLNIVQFFFVMANPCWPIM